MITQTCLETLSSYDPLKKFMGEKEPIRAARREGFKFSRLGDIVYIGLRNLILEVESSSCYRVPMTAKMKAEDLA